MTHILAPDVHYSRNTNNIARTTHTKRREPRPIECGGWSRGQMSQPHRDMKLPNEPSLLTPLRKQEPEQVPDDLQGWTTKVRGQRMERKQG